MIPSAERRQVLGRVARRIPVSEDGACVRVAVDGPDASGKTTFADELAADVLALGRPVARVSLDDFHNLRAVRYQQGRESPEGFWRHAFNYARFRSDVLDPFSPGGTRLYRPAAHDLATDTELNPEPLTALAGTVLVVDGLFLHRDELVAVWNLSVFLDVPFTETAKRMAVRDGTNPDPEHPSVRRYMDAQRIYFNACAPHQRADIHIDNQDVSAPRIIRALAAPGSASTCSPAATGW
ncbi:uridine kinase [Dactylosporangium sp. AC04546]|uniref:uridine kinase n=1 Tax=Dactylosporangium sp. AC04546 TaxID=2862460 RepID=UPI001EDCB436|nr:uridine kinase [Dactylosporangium sp. AC04546]WVK79420.1 uridine kinase [Dactylosporangium sp. AC04546]